MNPNSKGSDENSVVMGVHRENANDGSIKRQKMVNSETTIDFEMVSSQETHESRLHETTFHVTQADTHNDLSNLFANMALPGHDRRPDEYILVRQTGGDAVAGVTKGNLEHLPTKAEFNASCRLYRDGAGNYYPPPLAFERIAAPQELDAKSSFQHKLEVWNRAHAEMGITGTNIFYQTDKNIKLDQNYRLKPEDRYIQTKKYGRREVQKRYEHEFQAGSLLPDILIKTPQNDVHFMHRFAGDNFANKPFDEFQRTMKAKFGNDTEIKLKSKSGIMHDSKYLESWEKGSADVRFAEFAGENRAHNKQLPLATVNMGRQPDGSGGMTRDRLVSIGFLMQNAPNSPWALALKKGELWDRVQVLARDGNRYMTPPRLEYSDPEHFTQLMSQVGLPVSMGRQSHANTVKFEQFAEQAAVIAANGADLRDIRDLASDKVQQLTEKDVLIADRNEKSQRTGTYTSAAEYKRLMMKLPEDAVPLLGGPADKYSRDFVRPEPTSRPIIDSRRSYEVGRGAKLKTACDFATAAPAMRLVTSQASD